MRNLSNKQLWSLTQDEWENISENILTNQTLIQNELTNADCRLGYSGKTLVICFRGTILKWNSILTDLLVFKACMPFEGEKINPFIRVHFGFLNQYMSIRKELLEYLNNNIKKYDEILIIGHSLGAALSTICIYDLKKLQKFNVDIDAVIFGSPRVGNFDFTLDFGITVRDSITSYQVQNDIVNKVPLLSWNYFHIINEIKLGKLRPLWPFSIKAHFTYGDYL
jgi:predicted lipase